MTEINSDFLVKKIQNILKLNGFTIRRELCCLIIDQLIKHKVNINQTIEFNNIVQDLCQSFENQCVDSQSIEAVHIETALNKYLYYGDSDEEVIFEIIDAFKIPKMNYDTEKRVLFPVRHLHTTFIADSTKRTDLFLNRYQTVRIHVQKAFQNTNKVAQTIDYLLTYHSNSANLQKLNIFVLGSLLNLSEKKFALEDPTGFVKLDVHNANYDHGFFVENMFVLVTGHYEDKIMYVTQMLLPPIESYEESKVNLVNVNYFGGNSRICRRQSTRLAKIIQEPEVSSEFILFFADFRLDHPNTLVKLREIFDGFEIRNLLFGTSPPFAFVLMGSFLTTGSSLDEPAEKNIYALKNYLKMLSDLIQEFRQICQKSHFIFVPSIDDPCAGHTLPRRPIPNNLTNDFRNAIPNAHFVTNPCRLQFCNREIVLMRLDLLNKLRFGTLSMPKITEISSAITNTIISQAHLCPFSIAIQSVHWNYDHTLNLSPLPDLVVVGDQLYAYNSENKGCKLVNPGSFIDNNFTFLSYTPSTNTVDECSV